MKGSTPHGGTSRQVLSVVQHELAVALATRRALAVLLLYVLTAALGGAAYAASVSAIQRHSVELLATRGIDGERAKRAVASGSQHTVEQIVEKLAGTEGNAVAPSLTRSAAPAAFLWGSLAVLPLLILLTSFDLVAGELESRSLCYAVLRAPRRTLLFGKLVAQALLLLGVTLAASLVLVSVVATMHESFTWEEVVPGMLRSCGALAGYAFCYLGLSVACSALVRQPFQALLAGLGLVLALRLIALLVHVPDASAWSALRPLRWLSPTSYEPGLWEAGVGGPLGSIAVYLVFGAVALGVAFRSLERRDL